MTDSPARRREVESLRNRQIELYLASPKELVSHTNQERQTSSDYRGREILELLQNADDAAYDANVEGHLLFRLSRDRLIVANTGTPFTSDGIESLVVSYASSKQFSRRRHIGNKGLGFRSVLNWTERPLICSGDYAVAFSLEYARRCIEQLAAQSTAVGKYWVELQRSMGTRAAPLLRFPYVPDATSEDLLLAAEVLSHGYDTALVLPFSTAPRVAPYDLLRAQLDELGPEVLLFCRQLSLVRFEADGEEVGVWELERERGDPVLHGSALNRVCLSRSEQAELWTVHTRAGSLPPELIGLAPDTPDYEIAVAVPERVSSVSDHKLCVYFPTDEHVPTACLLHATLLLDASRKHPLAEDDINSFVLGALARLWVDTAEYESSQRSVGGLALLEGVGRMGSVLVDLGFREKVLEMAKRAAILPRLDGTLVGASDAVRAPDEHWSALLNPVWSPEALTSEAEATAPELLNALQIAWFPDDVLRLRLEKWIADLTPSAAGAFLGSALTTDALPADPPPSLLRVEGGLVAPSTLTVYTPKGGSPVTLPSWVTDFAFLDAEFVDAARAASGLNTLRALVGRLESVGYVVREFNAGGVTRHLVQAHSALSEDSGITRRDATRDVLRTLFPLVEAEPDARDLPARVPIITESGQVAAARDCYVGRSYPRGRTLHGMYGPLGEDEFVAAPEELGLQADAARVEAFLVRLGVADQPREIPIHSTYQVDDEGGYRQFVLESLPYPYQADDVAIASVEQALREVQLWFQNVKMPHRWRDVLEKGDPEAIIAYIGSDGQHHLSSGGQPRAMLGVKPYGKHKARWRDDVRFPPPALFLLRSKAWIPCADGVRRRPADVSASPSARRHLAGFLGEPSFSTDTGYQGTYRGTDLVYDILVRLGAFRSFADLDVHSRYDLLSALPQTDPQGKHAPSIYGALLEEHGSTADPQLGQAFAAKGLMWGRRGDTEGYFDVSSLRYATEAVVPEPVRRQVPLLAVPARKNATEIEALFGVRRLARDDYSIAVDQTLTVSAPWADEANRWFRSLVPVLYAYRLSTRADEGRERRRFSDVSLRACETITCSVTVGDDDALDVMTETYTGIAVQDQLLVVSQQPVFSPDPLFCDAVSEALADHLGVPSEAGAFAAFLLCPSPGVAVSLLNRRTGGYGEELYERALTQLEWADTGTVPIALPQRPHEHDEPEPAEAKSLPEDAVLPRDGEGQPQDGQQQDTFTAGQRPNKHHRSPVKWEERRPADVQRGAGRGAQEGQTLQAAEEFEIASGRFPLRVHTVVGAEAFGCDLISFGSEEDLQDARAAGEVDPSRVERFIEVKGRSSRLGAVELTTNEQKVAQERRHRYFLYRVFVAAGEVLELAVLQDPTASSAFRAVTRYEYDLVRSERTEWFVRQTLPQHSLGGSDGGGRKG